MSLSKYFFDPNKLAKQEAEIIAQYEAGDKEPPSDFGSYRMLLKDGRGDFVRRHAVMDSLEARLYAEQVYALCPGAKSIIDIGCGPGPITEAISSRYGVSVLGVDGAADAIEYARKTCPLSRFEKLWIEDSLPGTYDLIHARTFYPFARESGPEVHEQYLAMFLRHLNPGGAILLNVHDNPQGVFDPAGLPFDITRTLAPRIKFHRVLPLLAARMVTWALGPLLRTPQTYFYEVRP